MVQLNAMRDELRVLEGEELSSSDANPGAYNESLGSHIPSNRGHYQTSFAPLSGTFSAKKPA